MVRNQYSAILNCEKRGVRSFNWMKENLSQKRGVQFWWRLFSVIPKAGRNVGFVFLNLTFIFTTLSKSITANLYYADWMDIIDKMVEAICKRRILDPVSLINIIQRGNSINVPQQQINEKHINKSDFVHTGVYLQVIPKRFCTDFGQKLRTTSKLYWRYQSLLPLCVDFLLP